MPAFDSVNRRAFLKALSALGASAGLTPATLLADGNTPPHWQNWSGNQQASPARLNYPRSTDQVANLLKNSQGIVRPFGGSHSFSPLVPCDDTLLSIEALSGIQQQDDAHRIRYGAGTRLGAASAMAYAQGSSFVNEPDINLQSLAGAIATSTHGSGVTLPSLSAQVQALTLITPDGDTLALDADDGDLFLAACCHLGALGIVSDVTFEHAPAFRLQEHSWVMDLDDALDFVDSHKDKFRSIECFAFPLGGSAIVKTMEKTDNPEDTPPPEDSNETLEMACEVSMRAGWLTASIQKLLSVFVDEEWRRGPAHQVYANRRTVRFNEMEYTVPLEQGLQCLREVCDTIVRDDINVFFPIEFRYIAADDRLLSMFHGRAGASISVHQYFKQDYQPLFQAVEPVLRRYQGRPHWGKLHTLSARQLRELYPAFDRFLAVRQQLDPNGKMLNGHLKTVLGV
ncbi:FAD-dependent oxidoreductase [Alcanivorax hongdengensis A-11-3]|uniref:FAD-dependent oxidoreductase n=1 Tax=Alcanivorax hongdengensis A-11-3 TaxID=1177179 RepID=L0WG61_9GAMM|nr:D-arabinono-1,4-lactone oxidase [Alcanivorax hongdengensis]EKF75991.1 FAD-dependent oxidoreductase [Alcanivorax hongdengensis A-11-3]